MKSSIGGRPRFEVNVERRLAAPASILRLVVTINGDIMIRFHLFSYLQFPFYVSPGLQHDLSAFQEFTVRQLRKTFDRVSRYYQIRIRLGRQLKLAIVIRNLVDNAVKYTGSGGIGISASRENEHIQIQIQDTGQGMSALKIAEITAANEKVPGGTASNFGYRFIMELTRKLDGVVNIHSAPAGGTTVVVRFRA